MSQAVVRKLVQKKLRLAIPVDLSKVDEYSVGKVLLHSKKPQKVIPMRAQDLSSTGVSIASLLADKEQLNITLTKRLLCDTDQGGELGRVDVDVTDDLELQIALVKIPELKEAIESGDAKILHICADLGKLQLVSTDIVHSLTSQQIQIQVSHPVVQRALENGAALFVVGSVFEVDRCVVSVRMGEGGEAGSVRVISHEEPMTLGYKLVKVSVDSSGHIVSVLNKQLKSIASKHDLEQTDTPLKAKTACTAGEVEEDDWVEQYLYGMRDFQPFESASYRGILEEAKVLIIPLLHNRKLQDAFLAYTKPPNTYERLNALSNYFLDVGNAMRSKTPVPESEVEGIEPILGALSEEQDTRLDEITALILVAEAADEFPQHIVQMIIELPLEKRQDLLKLILGTPYGSSRHVYVDEGPYNDPTLKPILCRMGFSIPPDTHNLLHVRRDHEEEEDMLTAAMILMLGSEK